MGISFFPCANDKCDESCCDCGGYVECDCNCAWCSEECAKQDGLTTDAQTGETDCDYCRYTKASDHDLLKFVLSLYNLTREQVLERYKNERQNNPHAD